MSRRRHYVRLELTDNRLVRLRLYHALLWEGETEASPFDPAISVLVLVDEALDRYFAEHDRAQWVRAELQRVASARSK